MKQFLQSFIYFVGRNAKAIYLWFRGKKMFFLAAGTAIYGVCGVATGNLDWNEFMKCMYDAAVIGGFRAGINNAAKQAAKEVEKVVDREMVVA